MSDNSLVHLYDPPERFVAGVVGVPGQRTFFLQARSGRMITSVSVEKEQVLILADKINDLLEQVSPSNSAAGSDNEYLGGVDNGPLEQPLVDQFRVGTIQLSWDGQGHRVVIEAYSAEETSPEVLAVHLLPAQATAFAERAQRLVSAGRPPCIFCGRPLDAEGHLCVRANGFHRRLG